MRSAVPVWVILSPTRANKKYRRNLVAYNFFLASFSDQFYGWIDELGFYVPSTVFQSFRDDGRVHDQCCHIHMSRRITKPTKWHVRPVKTMPRLFAVHMKKPWVLSAQQDWSDWVDAQVDLSLHWAHVPFCWCCHEAAQILMVLKIFVADILQNTEIGTSKDVTIN